MAPADVRYNADVGSRRLRKHAYLPQTGHSHFDDRRAVALVEPEKRTRKPDIVIEVPLGLERGVLRGKHRVHHILRGGLSHASGHADQLQRKTFAVVAGKRKLSRAAVLHQYHRNGIPVRAGAPVGYRRSRALFSRRADVVVAVEALAPYRNKEHSRSYRAGVRGNSRNRNAATEELSPGDLCNFNCCKHFAPPYIIPRLFSQSRTISRSLNGTFSSPIAW